MLDPILDEFRVYLESIELRRPQIPFISNLRGNWITDGEATNPKYWVEHLRNTVQFGKGVRCLLNSQEYQLLEVGPGRTLSSLASLQLQKAANQLVVASMRHPDEDGDDYSMMLTALGRLWQHETEIDWSAFYAAQNHRIATLPTYSFDHTVCWIEPGKGREARRMRHEELSDCIYQTVWAAQATKACPASVVGWCVLLLCGESGFPQQLCSSLQSLGAEVIELRLSNRLSTQQGNYSVRVDAGDDYVHVLDALSKAGKRISHVVHALALELIAEPNEAYTGSGLPAEPERDQKYIFDSLFYLAQAIGNEDWAPQWLALTVGAQCVAGESMGTSLQGLLYGALPVIAHEFDIHATVVDLPVSVRNVAADKLAKRVIALLSTREQANAERSSSTIESNLSNSADFALRGNQLFARQYHRAIFNGQPVESLREGGCYLITGGLGGLGLAAAEAMAVQAKIKLVLLSRRKLPARGYWDTLIEQQAGEADVLQRIKQIEASASELLIRDCDVTDLNALRALASKLGPINGIVHTAGVLDDSLLSLKGLDAAHLVLQPKVQGSLALAQAFDLQALDFLLFYSSTSAFVGLPGQFDYAAANAFLDTFAASLQQQGVNAISVNWPAWQDIGMAARLAAGGLSPQQAPGRPVDHP
ncbi:MAG: SDR family NAD(P)-dependent oxidoreductase, partial [Pseudomonadales bacterium]|nr:SDR family NAD(P)-dependent oxidoreductase [Pseudomonadales bacterium]